MAAMPETFQAWRSAIRRDVPACGGDQVAALADFAFFFVAGLVALNVFAAALRAAGVFAVFMVLAASLLLAGAAAFAAVFGAAFEAAAFVAVFAAAGFAAAAGAAFFAGALAAGFDATAGFGAAAFLAGAAGLAAVLAVLAVARTAMACARGRFVVLSSFIVKSLP